MLLVICLAELLERYGNYLIAALLPLFLNEHERLAPAVALRRAGYYLALGYAGGVIGGFVADRFLGYRLATRLGTVLFGLGAALLTWARPGTLYPALALLVLGSSCFKPAVSAWLEKSHLRGDQYLFPSRVANSPRVSTRQYARIVHHWVEAVGLDPSAYGTPSMRRTKATLIYKRTKNLRAVQILLGRSKLESTVRYLGIDVDDALEISEQTEI